MGILKCGISQKRLIIERNERKFGTQGLMHCTCRVFFMSDYSSSVWSHWVHFTKFMMLTWWFPKGWSSKGWFSFNFNQTSEKACICNPGKYRLLLCLVMCQILSTMYMALWRKATSAVFPLPVKLYQFHLAKGETERKVLWASCCPFLLIRSSWK